MAFAEIVANLLLINHVWVFVGSLLKNTVDPNCQFQELLCQEEHFPGNA